MKPVYLSVVALLLSACGLGSTPCGPGGVEGARMLLLATDVEFARVARARGMSFAVTEFMASNAIFLPMNYQTLYGREDIAMYFSGDESITLAWTPADAEVAQSCDIGYSFGAWSVVGEDTEGNILDARGKYLSTWNLASGRWRVTAYMQNADPVSDGAGIPRSADQNE